MLCTLAVWVVPAPRRFVSAVCACRTFCAVTEMSGSPPAGATRLRVVTSSVTVSMWSVVWF